MSRNSHVATIVVIAALAMLIVACSASQSPASSGGAPRGSANSPSAVAYSRCVRSHGVPAFPDPDSSGAIPKADPQRLGVTASRLQAAQEACQGLLPVGGSGQQQLQLCLVTLACPQNLLQLALTRMRNFARCMRSQGVPNWPDPTIDAQGRPGFVISISKDSFDPHSPLISRKMTERQHRTSSPVALGVSS